MQATVGARLNNRPPPTHILNHSITARSTAASRPHRYLKPSPSVALSLSQPALNAAGDAYEVTLTGHSSQTRVHATCLLLAQEENGELDAQLSYDGCLTSHDTQLLHPPTTNCVYLSGRRLSDEQRYVLDRRNLPSRLGNMLKRPNLLLQPEEIGETESKREKLGEGGDFSASSRNNFGGMAARGGTCGSGAPAHRKMLGSLQTLQPNLNWLAVPSKVAVNLKPDASGKVVIPLELVNAARGGW